MSPPLTAHAICQAAAVALRVEGIDAEVMLCVPHDLALPPGFPPGRATHENNRGQHAMYRAASLIRYLDGRRTAVREAQLDATLTPEQRALEVPR